MLPNDFIRYASYHVETKLFGPPGGGSNPRPPAYKAGALTTTELLEDKKMVRQCGVDPLPNEGTRFTVSLQEPLALLTHENGAPVWCRSTPQ